MEMFSLERQPHIPNTVCVSDQQGVYTVEVTGADGTVASAPGSLTVIYLPTSIAVTPTSTNRSFSASAASVFTATPADGTAPFTYQWKRLALDFGRDHHNQRVDLGRIDQAAAGSYYVEVGNASVTPKTTSDNVVLTV